MLPILAPLWCSGMHVLSPFPLSPFRWWQTSLLIFFPNLSLSLPLPLSSSLNFSLSPSLSHTLSPFIRHYYTSVPPEHFVFDHVLLEHLVESVFSDLAVSFLVPQHLKELGVVLFLKLTFRFHREVQLVKQIDKSVFMQLFWWRIQ